MNEAIASFSNRPILGFIYSDDDGNPQFESHNMHTDDDGAIVYDEIPVGIIPESCDAHLEFDEEQQKNYVVVNGYLFDDYSKAVDILRRDKECACSVELDVIDLSYSADDGILNINKFVFTGVTILGKHQSTGDPVKPGMTGSNIQLVDFSQENNGIDSLIEKLTQAIDTFQDINSGKGGIQTLTKFDELLEQYGKTKEDITFEYEGLTDEELEAKFAEEFEEHTSENPESTNPVSYSAPINPISYSINMSDGHDKTFALSMDDIQMALSTLVNSTYSEADNAWYCVDVYPDEQELVMSDFWAGIAYRQSYDRVDDEFTLVGERVSVHRVWVTDEEDQAIANLRNEKAELESQLADIQAKLDGYQAAEVSAQKDELLSSGDYQVIADSDGFKELVEAKDTYSIDELKAKADALFMAYAKKQFASAKAEEPQKKSVRLPFNEKPSKRPYGGLFDEYKA